MTFSVVGRCANTGMLGMAIASSSPAVAARCAHAQAGVGVIATQNVTDPRLAPQALALLQEGDNAHLALQKLQSQNDHMDYRQVIIADGHGQIAIHSGANALGVWADAKDEHVGCGGNLLANDLVPQEMVNHFVLSQGHLADRLIASLRAGLQAGGEAGPIHSAGVLVVDKQSWPLVDLRCDWTQHCPITEVEHAWAEYKPQVNAYVERALNPTAAPSFGVPGDM